MKKIYIFATIKGNVFVDLINFPFGVFEEFSLEFLVLLNIQNQVNQSLSQEQLNIRTHVSNINLILVFLPLIVQFFEIKIHWSKHSHKI